MTIYQIVRNGDENISKFESKRNAIKISQMLTEFSTYNEYEVETVEQDDETTEADDNSSMSYDFITNDDEQSETTSDDDFATVGNMWTLGDHSSMDNDEAGGMVAGIDRTISELDGNVDDDMMAVLEDAREVVNDTAVSKFECPVETCGLGHSHPDHKHDIRDGFKVQDSFASQMEFCPYCHCGVNELSMLMAFFPYITETVFEDQHEFESIYIVEPDVIEKVYREYEGSVDMAVREAGVAYAEINGAEKDLKLFFERRQKIESAAEAAPIAQETRQDIDSLREELKEMTSQ